MILLLAKKTAWVNVMGTVTYGDRERGGDNDGDRDEDLEKSLGASP